MAELPELEEYYSPPFVVFGNVIEDSKGIYVCQCLEEEYAYSIALILNNAMPKED